MITYLDSSAFLAVVNPSDNCHASAVAVWQGLIDREERLITSSYVLIETIAVMHRRLGTGVVYRFLNDILPAVELVWADVSDHTAAVSVMFAHPGKSGPSIVDCVSFQVIRQRRIRDVFAYDKHFEGHGFTLIG